MRQYEDRVSSRSVKPMLRLTWLNSKLAHQFRLVAGRSSMCLLSIRSGFDSQRAYQMTFELCRVTCGNSALCTSGHSAQRSRNTAPTFSGYGQGNHGVLARHLSRVRVSGTPPNMNHSASGEARCLSSILGGIETHMVHQFEAFDFRRGHRILNRTR